MFERRHAARVPDLGLEDVDIHRKITRLQFRSILFHLPLSIVPLPTPDGTFSFKNGTVPLMDLTQVWRRDCSKDLDMYYYSHTYNI